MIRLLIFLCSVLYLAACTSTPTPPSKKPTPSESSSTQSAKDEEYKRKIAALEKIVATSINLHYFIFRNPIIIQN